MNETIQQETASERGAAPSEQPPASKKLGIVITQSAVDAVGAQIAKRNVPGTALRVGIRGGGCSGFSYVIEFHDGEPRARDIVYDLKSTDGADVRIVVDKKSLLYLNGATFDWEKTLMRQGFKFVNPNEKSSCGCGTSFTV
ncbi:MAG: iron-sulfur cluster assembly accessory protein [Labilithrix sp.]|nr:iron-sulfur cluster assembly accessory protein [Labilithrix sp.]MBX3220785.1 iron-sulfur cluster assembly accessory protein [Labilithrix sp.]